MKCDEKEVSRATSFAPESPYVIVCEGFQDIGLVCALLRHLGIDNCDVTYPKRIDGGNGKDAIGKVITLLADGSKDVDGVLVIADADDDPAQAFADICAAFKKFPTPTEPFSIIKANLRSGVFLLPGKGKTGALEHLLLEVVADERPDLLACVENYRACTQETNVWADNAQAKMKMQCIVAATCERNPSCSLAWVWGQRDVPMRIESPALQELADFLIDFSS